jgi:hypothetical protein
MIWLAIVALGNMGVTVWLVRENRRITQMALAKHTGDFTAMVRAEKSVVKTKPKSDNDSNDARWSWRDPLEGVAP